MTRRRLLLFGLLATLACAAVAVWLPWPWTAITRENAARIEMGMTLAEVEAILGGPARDEATGPVILDRNGDRPDQVELQAALYEHRLVEAFRSQSARVRFPQAVEWKSNQVSILVHFDCEGCVTDCNSIARRRADESLLAMFRRWLGQ
jgi:hypothetical protein